MVAYTAENLRNLVIAGHGTTGKTTLAESLMFNAGIINRQGRVEDNNTVSDFTEEEKNRGISISAGICSFEYNKKLLTVIDTPGYFDFAGEVASTIPFSESVLLTVKGSTGLDVGTEKAFETAQKFNKSVAFFINEIDRDNLELDKVISDIESNLGITLAPISFPATTGQNADSVINVLSGKLIKYANGKKASEEDLTGDFATKAEELKLKLMEAVAESDDALMEKYFAEGELSNEEVNTGLVKAFKEGTIAPLFFGAPNKGIGIDILLDSIISFFPSPKEKATIKLADKEIEMDSTKDFRGVVFKVNSIPQFGEVYVLKVLQGEINEGDSVYNLNSQSPEKFGQLYSVRGKERVAVKKAVAGQIVATVKLKNSKTGDQFGKDKNIDKLEGKLIEWPEAIVRGAFVGTSKEDTEKIASALKKMSIEDASFIAHSDPELKQLFVDGLGELHLEVISKKIKNQFGLNVNIVEPRIPYRETIKGKAEVRYRHKKQSGGAGEFAEVNIILEPSEEEFEFVNAIVGGVVSGKYIPAVEKGIKEVLPEGVISGCKFINCKVTLNDGKEHPVDSKEVAFKKAASVAFKDAVKKAKPIILEPIYDVFIKVPGDYAGDVMGDISGRRGKPLGMEAEGRYQTIKAQVPLKELNGYSTQLRSMTNGRGTYTIKFSHYEQVPSDVQQKIIDEYEKSKENN